MEKAEDFGLSGMNPWNYAKAGLASGSAPAFESWRLAKARQTLEQAQSASPFYGAHLAGVKSQNIASWDDFARLPFTNADMLAAEGLRMLCTSLGKVERVRSFPTSGSTGAPKRVWFTKADMERTIDFFAIGMAPLATVGAQVAVLMSDGKPGSIGALLCQGLARNGAVGHIGGNVRDVAAAGQLVARCDCVVGLPAEVLYLCRKQPGLRPKTVLLSADYVSPAIAHAVEETWGCRVFTHYGLTETCYGLAVQCVARAKQHLRAADFYVEVINPNTGTLLPEGQEGELVLTSLQNEALPLVRYRTGDVGSLVKQCPCGCGLPGLGPIKGRAENLRHPLNIHRLDDILFAHGGLCGYTAARKKGKLLLTIEGARLDETMLAREIGVPVQICYGAAPPFTGRGKRRLEERE